MNEDEPSPRRSGQPRGFLLGRVGSIELRLDVSVILIFGLIVASLGWGTLDAWHPDWSGILRWSVALGAGALFLLSIVLHELAHSLVAQAYDIPVPRITLFLFGGISQMQSEPRKPGQEFLIAAAGPALSLVLGAVCVLAGSALAGAEFSQTFADDPEAALATLTVAETLLLWLGPVNLVLGLFNLVPGFPLDGGRVLRSALWWATGDRLKATSWAAGAGQVVAFLLMALGIAQIFAGSLGGLWIILVGWFLNTAARTSHSRMVLEESLRSLQVRDLMRTQVRTLPSSMTVREFARDVVRTSDQGVWPVYDAGRAVGTVSTTLLERDVEPDQRLADVAAPLDATLSPSDDGPEALRELTARGNAPLVVLDEQGEVVGLLRQWDIARWLATSELEAA